MEYNYEAYPVLLAEDDPISRRLFEKILVKEGFPVTAVENGRKALDLFRRQFFPIVLTDWQMPEMEGPELCRAIREENPDRYVFIVMLTSKGSKDDIISGLGAGADDYLTKPAHYAELIARIETGIRILELEKSLKAAVDEILPPSARIIEHIGDGNWVVRMSYNDAMHLSESARVSGYHFHETTVIAGNLVGLVI